MASQKSKFGPLGNFQSAILIVLVFVILLWAYKTCQNDLPTGETATENTDINQESYPVIFISVDSLNMRSGPHLDSTIVTKLRIGEPLLYLNEKTPFRQQINFDGFLRDDPWVKVKTRNGTEGWIYAAGARFFAPE